MNTKHLQILQSQGLSGSVELSGAKNAILVIMTSLLLTSGKSKLLNVPMSDDVKLMAKLLNKLGVSVTIDEDNKTLYIDTSDAYSCEIEPEMMKKIRASILVLGPLLAKFSKADIALPGGDMIGARPIDYHIKAFKKMGATIVEEGNILKAKVDKFKAQRIVLTYPSVGATENILMAACLADGVTEIINAAVEPEVIDLVSVLKKMGAKINIQAPATIIIEGVSTLNPIEHAIICDRLEAGSLLLATCIVGGSIDLPNAPGYLLDVFLEKLTEMGHEIKVGANGVGISLKATSSPQAVSFKTMPYPGFPTDLQAPMIAVLCLASGTSVVEETVYENRFLHVPELQKMGAQITVQGTKATIKGVDNLYGASVIATDIRAACSLLLAGLAAQGTTTMSGVHHLNRGYDDIVGKINKLGGFVDLVS